MIFSRAEAEALDEVRLRAFLARSVPEGPTLDYKSDLSSGGKNPHKEFLKDVSAFANSEGGTLLIGVAEPNSKSQAPEIVELADASQIASDTERVAAESLDPRVPGLLVRPVLIGGGSAGIVIVHVPPSINRPHMVRHRGHRAFYIRHSESSMPMTTSEVRNAVVSVSSSLDSAKRYCEEQIERVQETLIAERPALFLQATPLIPPSQDWNPLVPPLYGLFMGGRRISLVDDTDHALYALNPPTPTMEGAIAPDTQDDPEVFIEIHRSGYIGVTNLVPMRPQIDPENPILFREWKQRFTAFASLCEECWEVSEADYPYLLRSTLVHADKVRLFIPHHIRTREQSATCGRQTLRWPDQSRTPGETLHRVVKAWSAGLFHGFGRQSL